MGNLGVAYYKMGSYEKSLKLQLLTLEYQKRVLPPDAAPTVTTMSHLAMTHRALGHIEESVTIDEEVLEVSLRTLHPDDPDIASSLNNLACGYLALVRPVVVLRTLTL